VFLWVPHSWFVLLVFLVTAVMVFPLVMGQLLRAAVIYSDCFVSCGESPDHLGALLPLGVAGFLLLLPFIVVRYCQGRPPASKRIRWTVTATVLGYGIWWLAARDMLGIML
jgi:hypothetical protein